MKNYNPNKRENDPLYLMRHVRELLKFAERHENSSFLIYACLDSRIALEHLDLFSIIASVSQEEEANLLESSKPKNGIDKLNNKHKSLKERYQSFFEIVGEIIGINWIKYDFKKSKDLQNRLSAYIHSYYFYNKDLEFKSTTMQNIFSLIDEVQEFIKKSMFDGKEYRIIGIDLSKIPQEDKILLDEWKNNLKMTVEELREKLKMNSLTRKE